MQKRKGGCDICLGGCKGEVRICSKHSKMEVDRFVSQEALTSNDLWRVMMEAKNKAKRQGYDVDNVLLIQAVVESDISSTIEYFDAKQCAD